MNMLKTTMLLAALTTLFMALGYTLGGSGGAVLSLLVAAGMNLFTYWNADKIVLKMHNAREVDAQSEPNFHGHGRQSGAARQYADAARLYHR
jgi:heat shock protein HtpX